MKKVISKKLKKNCVICGKQIKIILYQDRTYRGGHYFGRIIPPKKSEYWEYPKCYRKG